MTAPSLSVVGAVLATGLVLALFAAAIIGVSLLIWPLADRLLDKDPELGAGRDEREAQAVLYGGRRRIQVGPANDPASRAGGGSDVRP